MGFPGSGLIHKATHAVTHAGSGLLHTAGHAAERVGGVASGAKNLATHAVHDVVSVGEDFGAGVAQWGKDSLGTVKSIAEHPVETVKGLGRLATNPVLNPMVGLPLALVQGKNPVEAYRDGGEQLKDLGTNLVSGWKQAYHQHGVAGVLGYAAPDVALALLTDGGTAAAKGGAEVAVEAVGEAAMSAGGRSVARETAESVAKQVLVPGPEDIAQGAQEPSHGPSWLDRLREALG